MLDDQLRKRLWEILKANQDEVKAAILDKKKIKKRQRRGRARKSPAREWNAQVWEGTPMGVGGGEGEDDE